MGEQQPDRAPPTAPATGVTTMGQGVSGDATVGNARSDSHSRTLRTAANARTLRTAVVLCLVCLAGLVAIAGTGAATGPGNVASGTVADGSASLPPAVAQVTADCELGDDEAPPGSSVTLWADNSTDADGYEYDRDGDGSYETDRIDDSYYTFLYNQSGTYTPTIRVYNLSEGTTDTAGCGTLVVDSNENPTAALEYAPSNPAPNQPVTFDPADSSDPEGDEIIEYTYDVTGSSDYDVFRETDEPVEYAFADAGTYTVKLRVRDEHDGTDTTTVTVEVGDRNEPPTASFYHDPDAPTVGERLTFDARESTDPDGTIERYVWDFDGDGSDDESLADPIVDHSYDSPGTYEVSLSVVDDEGATDVVSTTVTVEGDGDFTCAVEPLTVVPGEPVSIDTSGALDPDSVEIDVDGDGTYDYESRGSTVSHSYEAAGEYTVSARSEGAAGFETADCGTVTVRENDPPEAAITLSPQAPAPGDTVTLDASGSTDPDGSIVEYRWDLDGDGSGDRTTTGPQTTVQYTNSTELAPRVTVVDDQGATDTAGATPRSVTAACTVRPADPGSNETVTIDATESDGGYAAQFDVDGDGTHEYENQEFAVEHAYPASGTYRPRVRVVGELGSDEVDCPAVDVGGGTDGGSFPPFGLFEIGGLLTLTGLGGGAYYFFRGSSDDSRPPRPPTKLPSGDGLAAVETGTFVTPAESTTVSVGGLGFEPDLILFSASTTPADGGSGAVADRTDGWAHGRALRQSDGSLLQSTMALADDGLALDRGMGASNDGHALELLVHYDEPPERLLGTVTETTDDGFEMAFDATGLRGDWTDTRFEVLYQAFGFSGEPQVEVGHFRTPDHPGTQTIELDVVADHVFLFGTNTVDDVGSHPMTDLPLGFTVGDVIGSGDSPAQLVRTATASPSMPGSASYAAFDDRALHLQYGSDGTVRGHTTARATHLSDRLVLEYDSVYGGPHKLGSDDSKLVSYVAMNTGDVQPVVGYFQLPEPGSQDLLAVDLGFRPSMVEFQSFGLTGVNTETVVDSPLSFGWSHGTVIADDGDVRHQVVDESTGPAGTTVGPDPTGPEAIPGRSPGVAASVRTLADGGRITGRDEVTVTKLTDTGFELLVTDVGTGERSADDPMPYVFYKAWPQPVDDDPN